MGLPIWLPATIVILTMILYVFLYFVANKLSLSLSLSLTIYTFLGALASYRNYASCKIHFASKSCVLLYWQRYCTAFEQRPSAKFCGMVQEMELRNFRRGRYLYSAGRPSRWASAHILVYHLFSFSNVLTKMFIWMRCCRISFSRTRLNWIGSLKPRWYTT